MTMGGLTTLEWMEGVGGKVGESGRRGGKGNCNWYENEKKLTFKKIFNKSDSSQLQRLN